MIYVWLFLHLVHSKCGLQVPEFLSLLTALRTIIQQDVGPLKISLLRPADSLFIICYGLDVTTKKFITGELSFPWNLLLYNIIHNGKESEAEAVKSRDISYARFYVYIIIYRA